MSEFHVPIVRIGEITKHPNADTLSITNVFAYPVIFRTGEYTTGDLAVYVPVDSVVPGDDPRWEFLGGSNRIKAKKLRGIFSMGLLTKAEPGRKEGEDAREELRITKYEPAVSFTMGQAERDPGFIPVYTDIEGYRRYPDIIKEGEKVVISEKIHGASARFVYWQDRLWVGSHHQIKKEDENSIWWKVARKYDLENLLREHAPGIVIYGEVFGNVQDLKYGMGKDVDLRIFDMYDITRGVYLDHQDFQGMEELLELPYAPIFCVMPWDKKYESYANGKTHIGEHHCREGIVIKPVVERWNPEVGRVILKLHGEDYLLRKES